MVAALRSAALGVLAVMVLVLVAWASTADSGADATDAVATALQAWLVAHHAHLAVPGGELALDPLGLTLLPLVLLHTATVRAGRAAGVRGRTGVLALASSVTATYAVVATLVALLARTDAVQALPVSAFLGAAGVAALGSGTGAVRATGTWAGVSRRLPAVVRAAVAPAAAALATLVAGGALLVGGSLAVHHGRAVLLIDSLGAGIGGRPPGGAAVPALPAHGGGLGSRVRGRPRVRGRRRDLGVGRRHRPGRGAGLPAAGRAAAGARRRPGRRSCCSVPVAAGVVAGLLCRRSGSLAAAGWRPVAEAAAVAGGLLAGAVAVLCLLASGPAGPGRLGETGPTWWLVAVLAGLEVAAVMAATLLRPAPPLGSVACTSGRDLGWSCWPPAAAPPCRRCSTRRPTRRTA